jgi:hypothetical protein
LSHLGPHEVGAALDAIWQYFTVRAAAEEPEYDLRGVMREVRTYGPGPIRPFKMGPPRPPHRTIVVTDDPADLARAGAGATPEQDVTIIEPALPFGPDYLAQLLFDSESGQRRADTLILGASAVAGDRRSMKPVASGTCRKWWARWIASPRAAAGYSGPADRSAARRTRPSSGWLGLTPRTAARVGAMSTTRASSR